MYKNRFVFWIYGIVFFLSFSSSVFSKTTAGDETPTLPKEEIIPSLDVGDRILPLSDREKLLKARLEESSLVGDFDLMMSYYSSLMQSFISKDEQTNILDFSIEVFPKLLAYKNYNLAQKLAEHLHYRIDYYSQEPRDTKTQHARIISLYETLLSLLPQKTLFQSLPTNFDRNDLKEKTTSKPSLENLLGHAILGLSGKKDDLEGSLQELYIALDIANTLHMVEMYYIISTTLVQAYVDENLYSSALIRLNFLYRLFSTVKFSDYYRIKVLIYFIKVDLLNNDMRSAYTVYLRVNDMIRYNMMISSNELLQLEKTLNQITPKFIGYIKDRSEDSTRNFLNHFIDTSPGQITEAHD